MIRPVRLYTHISPGSKKPPKKAVICVLPARTFNLSEPFSALKLALVLHRSKFVTIQQCSSWEADETLPWRADLCARDILEDDPQTPHADFSSREAIALWAEEVYKANESKRRVSDMDRRGANLGDQTSTDEKIIPARGRSASSSRSRLNASTARSTHSLTSTEQSPGQSSQTRTSYHGNAVSATRSNQSASRYVQRTKDSRPRTQRYFVVRKVIFCNAQRGLDKWIKVPKESIHALSPVWFNTPVEAIRRSICSEQEHLLTELLTAYATSSTCFLGPMTDSVRSIVLRSLHGIFQVVQAARFLGHANVDEPSAEGEAKEVHSEATYRFHWDQLIQIVTEIAAVSDMGYRKETKLRYPEYSPPRFYNINRDVRSSDVTDLYNVVLPPAGQLDPGFSAYWWHASVTTNNSGKEMDLAAAIDEPRLGTPDGILFLSVDEVFPSRDAADAVAIWQPKLATAPVERDKVANTWSTVKDEQIEPKAYGGSILAQCGPHRPFDARARTKYQQSMRVAPLEDPPSVAAASGQALADMRPVSVDDEAKQQDSLGPPQDFNVSSDLSAHFPLLVCEYKQLLSESAEAAATDQERLSLVAICTFMRLFNIARFPIFGLLTSGPIGVLSSAWNDVVNLPPGRARDTTQNVICIADEQATKVDIRDPLDALNVATFVAYIMAEHAPMLRALFSLSTSEIDFGYLLDEKGGVPRTRGRSLMAADAAWHKLHHQHV
ncbi:hypothetical protein PUNSTDRAFT_137187 [Punctularia strigosozonata HHB-11173 SS5]|uniref:uncharacterized protein n=1 Tax=Punctularia strigosozonata (strain HHB-11173) TaxID=741275 RepID=UPI0004417004|nr:uncharacterized protein PUNSTDRAFT_137187 [Punctularia strigosozonata HHB-11173 SS5]EIN05694.1 hypothetical protein PUNSTDRAFT_137187 [Punctularia strigosozonata HHB-11173 SS5]